MAAIFFHPDGYSTAGPKLMGRNAAGESFLRGYFGHARAETLWAYVEKEAYGAEFIRAAEAAGTTRPTRLVTRQTLPSLRQAGVLYRPDPGINREAWRRAPFGDAAWSLCGITHTTSSAWAMDAIADLLVAPVQPWDSVICTSDAVKRNVGRIFEASAEHFERRFGARPRVFPQLPVIPLGIHAGDYRHDGDARAAARRALGVDDDTVVVLFLGRLSFHAKAHPLAMYQALESAAADLPPGGRVLLIECGWFANDFIEKAFAAASALACPRIEVRHLDGRVAENRSMVWAGADIFCSLSDNIQETFGLTPIEAMAAGMPVVVSDWDGYRETVRDGIDGFRIPTLMPPPGAGELFALRHALEIDTYDTYCGYACAHVAVDIDACAKAFGRLFASPALRRQMGEAGRARVAEHYDWRSIIPRYEALWDELAAIRAAADRRVRPPRSWPARLDPFHAFEGYPTRILAAGDRLVLVDGDVAVAIRRLHDYLALEMVNYAKAVLPPVAELEALLQAVSAGRATAGEVAAHQPDMARDRLARSLVWLEKLGLLRSAPGA